MIVMILKVSKNQTIFVALCVVLVSTAVIPSQIVYAQNAATTTLTLSPTAPTTRIFHIFNTYVPAFNETKGIQKANLASDEYSLQTILVNQGDKVSVNFYNMEAPSGAAMSFTIGAPYNVDIDTKGGQDGTVTFVADHPGIFKYHCKHMPWMVGELIVLPNKT